MGIVWIISSGGGCSPFGWPLLPVDDLILSLCAYLPFEQVLPGPRQGDWVPFPQAVEALTQRPGWDAVGIIMAKDTPALVRQAARSPRFQTLGLAGAAGVLDQQTQFAALTFRLPDSTLYLAFRGTDDTLVGWKECFAMSYAFPVPAQALAQDYLVQVAQRPTRAGCGWGDTPRGATGRVGRPSRPAPSPPGGFCG